MGKIKKVVSIIAIILIIVLVGIVICFKLFNQNENIQEKQTYNENTIENTDIDLTETLENDEIKKVAFDKKIGSVLSTTKKFDAKDIPYTEEKYETLVADYFIEPDLSNVENINDFELNEEQRSMLAKNGFVVSPTNYGQMNQIYDLNSYQNIPSFITTDSVLHLYHVLYDYSLKNVENNSLYEGITQLNTNMLYELIEEYSKVENPEVKKQLLNIVGFFGVPQILYGQDLPDEFPKEIIEIVEKEAKLAEEAAGMNESKLLEIEEFDYSLFKPRGHYTESAKLEKYFRGTSWYGNAYFDLKDEKAIIRAIIISNALNNLEPDYGINIWNGIYGTTSFFVGEADDINPHQIIEICKNVYGETINLEEINNHEKLELFKKEMEKLPSAGIKNVNNFEEQGLQFRFMGQRYVADSEILQELCTPILRVFPNGLDVISVLGSERAKVLNDTYYKPSIMWPGYTEKFVGLKEKFSKIPEETWHSNMYYAWLDLFRSVTKNFGQGYPMFMRNDAWKDKAIATSLGSWAELRHDTILYAKQSTCECGGGEEEQEVPVIRSYVEPNIELYNKLLWLTKYSSVNLKNRNIISDEMENKMSALEDMLEFLIRCSKKQLRNEELSQEEYDELLTYGGWLENMTLRFGNEGDDWYEIDSAASTNMALIADVHRGADNYLEEAIGLPNEIYVIVPINGKLYITRGATFDYYEFCSPVRLTDEEWRANMNAERPVWTESFMALPEEMKGYVAEYRYRGGC